MKAQFGLAILTNKLEIPRHGDAHWKHARVWDRWQEEGRASVGAAYRQQRIKVIDYIGALHGPLDVLELCCGTGRLAHDLLDNNNISRLYTVDISPQAINLLQQHLQAHPRAVVLRAGVANVLEFVTWPPPNQFDVVICTDALPNISWSDLPPLFHHINRMTKPAGRFVGNYLSSETIDAHTTRKHGAAGYYRIYSRLVMGKLLNRIRSSLAGQKGLLRTGTAFKADLTGLLESHFTIDRIESDVYHWFAALPKK